MDDGLNLVGLDLSHRFLCIAQDASVGSIADTAAKLLDLLKAVLFASASFGASALATYSQALEHPVSSKSLGCGSFWWWLVDLLTSVRGQEDGLEAQRDTRLMLSCHWHGWEVG